MNKTVCIIFAVCAAMFASCSRVEELTLEEIARINGGSGGALIAKNLVKKHFEKAGAV